MATALKASGFIQLKNYNSLLLRVDSHKSPSSLSTKSSSSSSFKPVAMSAAVTAAVVPTVGLSETFANLKKQGKGDDIQTKVRDSVKPQLDRVREKLVPARTWAENMSKRWKMEKDQSINAKPMIVQKLSKVLGAKSSSN